MRADRLPLTAETPLGVAAARMRQAFAEAELESPELDVRRLLCAVGGIDAAALVTAPERPLGAAASALNDAMARRLAREPVSRIVGERAFHKHTFLISSATLDPRPETETLVEAVLDLLKAEGSAGTPRRLLDIGTGSGCILLSLLAELPLATGIGTDISERALDVAAANARRLGVSERVQWQLVPRAQSEAEAVYRSLGGVDVIVSNPPYIPTRDIAGLLPEVRSFDPIAALDGGEDGLDLYRQIARLAPLLLRDGWLAVEIGAGQAGDACRILAGLTGSERELRSWNDLGGIVRCVAARIRQQPC